MSIGTEINETAYKEIRNLLAEKLSIEESEVPEELVAETYNALLLEKEMVSDEQTIIDKFESHCLRIPKREAIFYGKESVTFNRIREGMNRVAKALLFMGIKPGRRVGVHVEDPINRICAILGVMRAGAVVIALDPLDQLSQKRSQIKFVGSKYFVCESKDFNQLELDLNSTLLIDQLEDSITIELPTLPSKDDIAYISIATGEEVALTHSDLVDRTASLQAVFKLQEEETFALWQVDSSEAWLYHALWPFTIGATLLIPSHSNSNESLITCLSELKADLAYIDSRVLMTVAHTNIKVPEGLRAILCGSEPIYQSVVDKIMTYCNSDIYFCFELGGFPLNFKPVKAQRGWKGGRLSLGTPRMGRAILLDTQGQEVEEGVIGYIHLWNGSKLVSTGLKAVKSSEGDFRWVESQNKSLTIVGQQLFDTNRILTALMKHSEVADAVILVKTTKAGCSQPVAFVVLKDENVSSWDLYEKLRLDLPRTYIDFKVAAVTAIPLINGKVDEATLLKIPVISSAEIHSIEQKVRMMPGISAAEAITVSNRDIENGHIHLSDALPSEIVSVLMGGTTGIKDDDVQNQEELKNKLASLKDKSPAYLNGGKLTISEELPKDLANAFQETARKYPNKGIYFIDSNGKETFKSYQDLLVKAKNILGGLQTQGVKSGDRVILQIDSLEAHLASFWACILGGITPATVAIAPSYKEENGIVAKIYHTWRILDKPLILTLEKNRSSMQQMSKLYSMEGLDFLTVEDLENKKVEGNIHKVQPNDIAFFQLTSGSTGAPKCIQEVHEKIIFHIHAAKQNNGYSSEDITLNWLQPDHVVPILTSHLKDVYLGCSQVHVQTDFILSNPLNWLDLIQKYQVSHSWSPNFGFKIVSEALKESYDKNWNLSSLKYLMNAGEQVTLPVVSEFLDLTKKFGVSEKVMQPAFGMAEVCTCMTYCNDFSRDIHALHILKSSLHKDIEVAIDIQRSEAISFVSSGRPVKGVEIRIVNKSNSILQEGVIGRFQIRGSVVMPGYLNNEEANQESFVGDGWFNTGDLGFILNGELFITGREKELIIINGANFYCHEIEEVVAQIEGVLPTFVAACGIADSNTGTESLGIFFVPTTNHFSEQVQTLQTIRSTVASKLGVAPKFVIPLIKSSFLKTTSGKIQRDLMKKEFLNGQYDDIQKQIDLVLGNEKTIPNWFFKKTWVQKDLLITKQSTVENTLILGSNDGVGGSLASLVRSNGGRAILVETGEEFSQINNNHFIIDPKKLEDFEKVLSMIGEPSIHLVHAWQSDVDTSFEVGLYGLIRLLNATDRSDINLLNLMVITKSTWSISPGEFSNPESASISGILKTLEQERPDSRFLHIDFESSIPELLAKTAYKEFTNITTSKEVAFRNGKRMIPRLINAIPTESVKQAPIKRGGTYLVTGGTGGIGSFIAKVLIEQFDAKVLLVARSKINSYSELWDNMEKYKGKVQFMQADVANAKALKEVVIKYENECQTSILGAFHFAGVMEERLIEEESPETIANTIEGKVLGAKTLVEIFSSKPESFIVLSSSINGFYGGVKAGAYSAANAYLDALPAAMHQSYPNLYSIAWSQWEQIGMNKSSLLVDLSKAKGFTTISPTQGVTSLLTALCQGPGSMMIGLNPTKRFVASSMNLQTGVDDKVLCYYSGEVEANAVVSSLSKSDLTDEFGTTFDLNINWLETIPTDESGLRDKTALKRLAIYNKVISTKFQEPQSNTEKRLAEIWKKILRTNKIGVSDNFFELGGHSLLATQLVSRIRSQFAVELLIDNLFMNPTLGALAKEIDLKLEQTISLEPSIPLKRYNKNNQIPLSFAQERLWFLNQLSPGNPFYNIQQMIKIKGPLDWRDVEQAFKKLVNRQAILRTTFKYFDDAPIQIVKDVNDPEVFDFTYVNLTGYTPEKLKAKVKEIVYEESQKGFDLEKGPVLRYRIIRTNENEHNLLVTMHHIVSDAWSISILVREFLAIFQSASLPELPIEYTDFSLWQREWLSGEEYDKQMLYWKESLEGYSGILEVKADFPRPPMPSYKGERIRFKIPSQQVRELNELSQALGVTPNMVLLSVFNILLMKYSETEDIVVGMPIANRNRTEIEDLIGFFVNTLAIRTDLSGNPTFDQLVLSVKESLLGAYAHQDMPFEKVVNELRLERRLDRQPLCQAVFVMQNVPKEEFVINGLEFEMVETPHELSKFDLTLSFSEQKEELAGALEYSTDLFSRESMERFISVWNKLLEYALRTPNIKLSKLMISIKEDEEVIHELGRSNSLPGVTDKEFIQSLIKSHSSIMSVEALTPVQRDLYLEYLSSSKGGQYGLAYSIELGTKIDSNKWNDAVMQTLDNIPILKSRFFTLNGSFYQLVDNAMKLELEIIDGTNLKDTVSRYMQEPFDLFKSAVRLVLFKNSKTGVYNAVLICHHILLDAYSGNLFFNKVVESYKNGTVASRLEGNSVGFHGLVPERNSKFDRAETINYWQEATQNVQPLIHNPIRESDEMKRPVTETIYFCENHTRKIKEYCRKNSIGLPTYMRSLLGVMLERFYAPENDFVIFDVRGGRTKQENDVIGCLYQVLPIVFSKSMFNNNESSFSGMNSRVIYARKQLGIHENLSVFAQRQILGKEGIRFYTNFYKFSEFYFNRNKSRLSVHESFEIDEVHFIFEEFTDEIEIRLAYDESTWKSSRMLERLERLSEQILAGCDDINKFDIVLEDEIKLFTDVWNSNATKKENSSYSLPTLFVQQVEKTPEAIAITYNGVEISYRELNRRANQFSNYLIKKGIGTNSLVGLFLNPSIDTIVAIIGILKAGGTYLPIDSKYPSERVRFMIHDSGMNLMVTERSLKDMGGIPNDIDMVLIGEEWSEISMESEIYCDISIDSNQSAYVIYTSGSTGTPKGALLTHANVVRLFEQTEQLYSFNSDDVWTLFHSIAFDFSVWEIWGALLYGGKLVIVNPLVARSPYEFHELLRTEKVTVLNQTPSAFAQLIQADLAHLVRSELSLRYVIFGGEALNFTSLQPWFDRHGFDTPKLINMYGITETTVHVTYKRINKSDLEQELVSNIGTPIPDLQVYILDRLGKFSPIGAIGELYVGGAGLAQGYLNRENLTAKKFIKNNIEPNKSKLLYKTGDIGRWLPSGEIEYLGRSDHQIKIRGFRMELGEIESQIRKVEGVEDVAVVTRRKQGNEAELIAYIVSRADLLVNEVKTQIQQSLPYYMMPSAFVRIEKLPLTTNGKLDRKALPEPKEFDRRSSSNFIHPENEIQEIMGRAWSEVLGVQQVGIDDNFYDLGGHSLKLVDLQTKLNTMLKGITREITMVEVFQNPTIRSLSSFLGQNQASEGIDANMSSDRIEKRKQLSKRQRNRRVTKK